MRSRYPVALSLLIAIAMVFGAAAEASAAPPRRPRRPSSGARSSVIPISGMVLVTAPGQHVRRRLRQAQAVRSGSLVDLSQPGTAEIETAAPHGPMTHTADVGGAMLRITQPRGEGSVTNLIFSGKVPSCSAARATRLPGPVRVTVPAHRHRRYARDALSAATGLFRLTGKDGSAVNQASASYQGTEDCRQMTVADNDGTVNTAVKNGASSNSLEPGETWLSRCSTSPVSEAIGPYCLDVLGLNNSHGFVNYTTGLFIKSTAATFDLCQTPPGGPQVCQPWTLSTAGSSAEREGLVSCPVTQTGPYLLTWEIDGTALGPPVQYNGTAVGHTGTSVHRFGWHPVQHRGFPAAAAHRSQARQQLYAPRRSLAVVPQR